MNLPPTRLFCCDQYNDRVASETEDSRKQTVFDEEKTPKSPKSGQKVQVAVTDESASWLCSSENVNPSDKRTVVSATGTDDSVTSTAKSQHVEVPLKQGKKKENQEVGSSTSLAL